jgi:hypothetical protein
MHLWALLVAGGVDVVLNGHNHAYERLKPMRTMGDVDHRGALRRLQDGAVSRPLGRRPQGHRRVTRDLHAIGCH